MDRDRRQRIENTIARLIVITYEAGLAAGRGDAARAMRLARIMVRLRIRSYECLIVDPEELQIAIGRLRSGHEQNEAAAARAARREGLLPPEPEDHE